jgi:hypothetical protein
VVADFGSTPNFLKPTSATLRQVLFVALALAFMFFHSPFEQLEIVGVRDVVHMSFVTVCRVAATPLLQALSTCIFSPLPLKYFQASNIEVRFKPSAYGATQSVSFQIDGEPFSIPAGRIPAIHVLADLFHAPPLQMEE